MNLVRHYGIPAVTARIKKLSALRERLKERVSWAAPMTRAALCTRLCDHLTSNWRPAWTPPPDRSRDENWLLH
jgi:hypothetical protein